MNETDKKSFSLLGDSPVLEWGREDCLKFESTAKVLAGPVRQVRLSPFSLAGRKQENLPGLVDGGNQSAVPEGFRLNGIMPYSDSLQMPISCPEHQC
jgi:hypothetical protein